MRGRLVFSSVIALLLIWIATSVTFAEQSVVQPPALEDLASQDDSEPTDSLNKDLNWFVNFLQLEFYPTQDKFCSIPRSLYVYLYISFLDRPPRFLA